MGYISWQARHDALPTEEIMAPMITSEPAWSNAASYPKALLLLTESGLLLCRLDKSNPAQLTVYDSLTLRDSLEKDH